LKSKVAIVGASGLVGAALCERLFFDGEFEPVPLLHNLGRGARVGRLGIALQVADLLDRRQVLEAISGCEYIVNCSRNGAAVMINGLRNLLHAAQKTNAKGLIHISSAAIYGNPVSDVVITERTRPQPADEYAAVKLRQDEIVLRHASSLRCMILCPPTISGPYSEFALGLTQAFRQGVVPLVDEGRGYANVVHVDNLVEAIIAAIRNDQGWGELYLINQIEKRTWLEFLEDIRRMLGLRSDFVPVSSKQLHTPTSRRDRRRLLDNCKVLLSGEFRSALSLFPAFRALNERAYLWFNSRSPAFQSWVRRYVQQPVMIPKRSTQRSVDDYLVRIQARKAYYSPEKLVNCLRYRPILSYEQELQTLRSWLEFAALV